MLNEAVEDMSRSCVKPNPLGCVHTATPSKAVCRSANLQQHAWRVCGGVTLPKVGGWVGKRRLSTLDYSYLATGELQPLRDDQGRLV